MCTQDFIFARERKTMPLFIDIVRVMMSGVAFLAALLPEGLTHRNEFQHGHARPKAHIKLS